MEMSNACAAVASVHCYDVYRWKNEVAWTPQALESLANFLQSASSVTVLTGAGVSTGTSRMQCCAVHGVKHDACTCQHHIDEWYLLQKATFQTIEARGEPTPLASSQ